MDHLTDEQLARVALGLAEGEPLAAHVAQCVACQARLDKESRLTDQLAAAHAEVDQTHTASRERLLAAIQQEPQPNRRAATAFRWASLLGGLNMRQRIALGGVGLSTAALVLLILILANSARELSAMERITKAVRDVTSFSFRLSDRMTVPPEDRRPWAVRQQNDITYWQAPPDPNSKWLGNFNSESKSFKFFHTGSGDLGQGELSLYVKEVELTGKPGIVILYASSHGAKTYFRTPPALTEYIPKASPLAWLRAVRDREGDIVRDLGTKEIGVRSARGYVMKFSDATPFRGYSPVEVWVDSQTDLPIEYSFHWAGDDEEGIVKDFRVTDCRWNIELDPKLFDTTPPEGFIDTTPPRTAADISKVVDALKLYARLSGGHYPRVAKFDGKAIAKEMRQMAGFSGPPQPEWSTDETYQQIEKAAVGLDWMARVLLDDIRAGYFGQEVGPNDNDKVLLWWTPGSPRDGYRVFYGNLRTEIIPGRRLAELEPKTKDLVYYEEQ